MRVDYIVNAIFTVFNVLMLAEHYKLHKAIHISSHK